MKFIVLHLHAISRFHRKTVEERHRRRHSNLENSENVPSNFNLCDRSIDRAYSSVNRESLKSFHFELVVSFAHVMRTLSSRFKVRKNDFQVDSRLKMDSAFGEHELVNFFPMKNQPRVIYGWFQISAERSRSGAVPSRKL